MKSLRLLFALCLAWMLCFQAVASVGGAQPCRHSLPSRAAAEAPAAHAHHAEHHHHHHAAAESSRPAQPDAIAKLTGCGCGCQCASHCASAGAAIALAHPAPHFDAPASAARGLNRPSQPRPAHALDLLRPPSIG